MLSLQLMLLQVSDASELAEAVSHMDAAHYLAYSLILSILTSAAIIGYLLKRDERSRDQIVKMVELLTQERDRKDGTDAVIRQLTEHITLSKAALDSFGQAMTEFHKAMAEVVRVVTNCTRNQSSGES